MSARRRRRTARWLLSPQQRRVLDVVERYFDATGEPCPGRVLARRMSLHPSTVDQHLGALHRKGWLRGPNPPAAPLLVERRRSVSDTRHFDGTGNLPGITPDP